MKKVESMIERSTDGTCSAKILIDLDVATPLLFRFYNSFIYKDIATPLQKDTA